MTKLPEPDGYMPYPMCHIKRYTEAQMLQFRRDALEEAALVCDALTQKAISSIAKSAFKVSANDIRGLKDET
jgi:hypothetical protein